MLSFQIDNTIAKKLLVLNDQISKKYELIKTLPSEECNAIHHYARISMIGASTRIENAILTDSEIDWMDSVIGQDAKKTAFESQRKKIENKFTKDRQRSIEEVAGCRSMLQLIYEQGESLFPLTEVTLRGLHTELLQHLTKPGLVIGKYKESPNSVVEENHETGQRRVVFKTADPGIITESMMSDLVVWYNQALPTEVWSIAVITEFVYRFLAIHPFQDGNGRLGRGLFLLGLSQSPDKKLTEISRYLAIDRQIERHKEDYYFVLNQCSGGEFSNDPKKYQIQFFLLFMIKILEESLMDIDVYRKKYIDHKNLSESALKVLECFKNKPEIMLKPKEIFEQTGIPRRTVSHILTSLVEKKFLQSYGQRSAIRYQLVF